MLWMSVGVALELCIEALIVKSWCERRGLLACVCLLRFNLWGSLSSCVIWLHGENAGLADISCSLVNCIHLCVWQGDEVMFASISAVCCNIALKSSTSAVTQRRLSHSLLSTRGSEPSQQYLIPAVLPRCWSCTDPLSCTGHWKTRVHV